MTTLGKILVIINFVFTLVTGALIIMVFSVRTNWKASYDKLFRYYEVSQANVRTYGDEVKANKIKSDEDVKKLSDERDKLAADLKARKDEIADINKKLTVEKGLAAKQTLNVDTSAEELKRMRDELKEANDKVVMRDKEMLRLVEKNKDLLDKSVRNEIAARSSQDRAKALVEQLESLSREIDRLKTGPSTTASGAVIRRPPPEDVEGVIIETDSKSGLVTVSIGSDAGITKGNTLEVFRLKPEPKYLGTIRILDVNNHEAVGRPTAAQKAGMIQKGDRVASSIMGQR